MAAIYCTFFSFLFNTKFVLGIQPEMVFLYKTQSFILLNILKKVFYFRLKLIENILSFRFSGLYSVFWIEIWTNDAIKELTLKAWKKSFIISYLYIFVFDKAYDDKIHYGNAHLNMKDMSHNLRVRSHQIAIGDIPWKLLFPNSEIRYFTRGHIIYIFDTTTKY